MDIAVRPTPAVITPRRLAALVALLLLASLVGIALFAGARQPSLPAPFGVARNGLVVFADPDGIIQVGDLDTRRLRKLSAAQVKPTEGVPGRHAGRLSRRGASSNDVVVVGMDGTGRRTITVNPMVDIGFLDGLRTDGRRHLEPRVALPPRRCQVERSGDDRLGRERRRRHGLLQSARNVHQTARRRRDRGSGTSEGHDTLKVANADGTAAKVIVDEPCSPRHALPGLVERRDADRVHGSATGDQPFGA